MSNKYLILITLLTITALIINLPFGYWRARVRKFSIPWFLYIHLPVPIIFVLRVFSGISYHAIPILIVGAVGGQILGGRYKHVAEG